MPINEYYRVRQGITELVVEEIQYSVPTAKFAEALSTPKDVRYIALPKQLHSIFAEGGGRVSFLIEQPPTVRHVTWAARARRPEGVKEFDLAIPWVYMLFTANRHNANDPDSELYYEGMSIYCSPKPFTDKDHIVTGMPINNVEQNGRICFGTAAVDATLALGPMIDQLANSFWNSNFNYEHTPTLPGYKDYLEWQEDTKQNPVCWTNWPWKDQRKWPHPEMKIADLVKTNIDRATPAFAPDPIPTLPQAPTFGRAIEWTRGLTAIQRGQLKAAIAELEEQP